MQKVGVYVGNDPQAVLDFEAWLGAKVDTVAAHTGQANWSDWVSSIQWSANLWSSLDRTLTWSIPLFADQGNLTAAAGHAYDSYYVKAAKILAASSSGDGPIYVRTGEEFNGNWMKWAAAGHEAEFAQAFRNFVDSFRSVSNRFVFEWNVNVGDYGVNPADAYPGDAYVDIIGMDFYYNTAWDNPDPVQAWNYMVSRKYGLQWLENFASAHNKPTAYSEWGVESDNAGAYIKLAAAWFASHNVVYENYWESNADFAGALSDGQYATAGNAYKDAFGETVSSKPTVVVDPSLGDNLYVATLSTDVFAEKVNGGTDLVQASVSYTLGANIENLTLTGSGAISGTGNELDNAIVGNAAANILKGMAGNDFLMGGGGNDILYGDDGNDILDGGAGIDTMYGGAGDDSYYVDSASDVIVENIGEGIDTVYSYVTYKLGANVENLILLGSGAAAGTGNDLDNRLIGNSGNNTLKGMNGEDYIDGGAGNDIIEGGAGADTLNGGDGDDMLTGGSGADTLWGGAGSDTFVLTSLADSKTSTIDIIMDLEGKDFIDLRQIDANTSLAGDQAFTLVSAFTKQAGQAVVTYDALSGMTSLNMDVNGDGRTDGTLYMMGDQRGFTGWLL